MNTNIHFAVEVGRKEVKTLALRDTPGRLKRTIH